MEQQPIIVIGGSAGSISVLTALLAQLPQDLNAAVLIVVHLSRDVPSNLPSILQRQSALPIAFAQDDHPIQSGQVYVAPPDYHLFVKPGKMLLIRGPLENRMRPSIDVLFRSSAVAYTNGVTGVLLSGLLDDGTVGLQAIRRCGGTAIVQSPEEALCPDMPENAIAQGNVDHIAAVNDMGSLLVKHTAQPLTAIAVVPDDLRLEAQMVERVMFNSAEMTQIGEPIAQSCPGCGGPLWQMKSPSDTLRYRCHVGHGFTARSLLNAQDHASEQALWVALRTLEERGRLLVRISEDAQQRGSHKLAQTYRYQADETLTHAESIRKLLYSLGSLDTLTEQLKER